MEQGIVNTFTIIGFVMTIVTALFAIWIISRLIKDTIVNAYWRLKNKYMIKHRFDKPPVAKCYCIDCRYGEHFGTTADMDSIYGKCMLQKSGTVIRDNDFCCHANPNIK